MTTPCERQGRGAGTPRVLDPADARVRVSRADPTALARDTRTTPGSAAAYLASPAGSSRLVSFRGFLTR